MNRKELMLAALSPAKREAYTPVQVQKLFFLIDQNISKTLGGRAFNFKPYHYGPFDRQVYQELDELYMEKLVEIDESKGWNNYRLSLEGQRIGDEILSGLPNREKAYIVKISDFVRKLSFTELVAAIYKAYPKMRRNSVFQD